MSGSGITTVRRLASGELVDVLPDGTTRPHRPEAEAEWGRVERLSEEELERAVAADPAWQGVPPDWVERAEFALPEPKQQISLRVDADVLRWFRRQGPGYQSRMNAVLRSFMRAHTERRRREP
jgi:uncharacterized protein (DUF4415 family)